MVAKRPLNAGSGRSASLELSLRQTIMQGWLRPHCAGVGLCMSLCGLSALHMRHVMRATAHRLS
jgi:hypothetical protein